MNFEKVYNDIRKACDLPLFIEYELKCKITQLTFYHVIIHHKSAFWKTFDKNFTYYGISPLCNCEHVHLIVLPKNGRILENNAEIQSEPITSSSKYHFIYKYIIYSKKAENNFFCNFTFIFPSLKYMCITSIIKNLNYLHDMETLKLPKILLKEIFQQSKSRFHLPEFHGQNYTVDKTTFELFNQQDKVYQKKFVAWFQATEFINSSFECESAHFFSSFECELAYFFVVYYYFTIDKKTEIKMCLKCMKFENKNGCYQRKYFLLAQRRKPKFIRNPLNWCQACQQVPLFQMLTFFQYDNLYAYNIYENDWYNRSGLDKKLEPLIKIENFENDVKIESQYMFSKKYSIAIK